MFCFAAVVVKKSAEKRKSKKTVQCRTKLVLKNKASTFFQAFCLVFHRGPLVGEQHVKVISRQRGGT